MSRKEHNYVFNVSPTVTDLNGNKVTIKQCVELNISSIVLHIDGEKVFCGRKPFA